MSIENKALSKNFGERIRRIREEEGITQQTLAERLGVNRSTVNRLEKGTTRITLERLSRVLDALGYEASLSIQKRSTSTSTDWGVIQAENPLLRRHVRTARRIAERIAELLYNEYDVEAVHAFGSLAEHGSANFDDESDLDLIVRGLNPEDRFEAQNESEDLANDTLEGDVYLEVDLVRQEDFPVNVDKLSTHFLPEQSDDE